MVDLADIIWLKLQPKMKLMVCGRNQTHLLHKSEEGCVNVLALAPLSNDLLIYSSQSEEAYGRVRPEDSGVSNSGRNIQRRGVYRGAARRVGLCRVAARWIDEDWNSIPVVMRH